MRDQLIRDIVLPVDADKEATVNAESEPFIKTDDSNDSPVSNYD